MSRLEFSESIIKEWERLRSEKTDVSLWEAFTNLVKDSVQPHVLTLRADMDIVRYLAQGYNVSAIHRMTGIPSKAVRKIAFTWGLEPLEETLDFNVFLMYNRGMTADMLFRRMNDFLPKPLPYETYITVINNIERYYDLEEFLQEEEQQNERG